MSWTKSDILLSRLTALYDRYRERQLDEDESQNQTMLFAHLNYLVVKISHHLAETYDDYPNEKWWNYYDPPV